MSTPAALLDRPVARQAGVSVARALGSTTRAGIYEHLQQAGVGLTVRDIAAAFELHPNVARTHLELLADAGLVVVGRRKHPGGGRPAKVYVARDVTPEEEVSAPAPAGDPAAPLLVALLVGLLDGTGDRAALLRRAAEAAAAQGRRLVATAVPVKQDDAGARSLQSAAATALRAVRALAPEARVARAGDGWVDLAGVRGVFDLVEATDLAEALERGLVAGAFAGAGAHVTLTEAGTAPGGGALWRARASGPVSARPPAVPAAVVDARGQSREAGVVTAMRRITRLQPGDVLEILAEGPGSPAAFARWADRAGHELLAVERATDAVGGPAIRLLLRKGAS